MLIVPDVSKLEKYGFYKGAKHFQRDLDTYEKFITCIDNPLDESQVMRVSLAVNPIGYGRFPDNAMVLKVEGKNDEGVDIGDIIPLSPILRLLYNGVAGCFIDTGGGAGQRYIAKGERTEMTLHLGPDDMQCTAKLTVEPITQVTCEYHKGETLPEKEIDEREIPF